MMNLVSSLPRIEMFDDAGKHRVYVSALEVLERTGVSVRNDSARQLLREAGARIDGEIVRIPCWLVENAIRTTPRQITIYSRDGNPAMRLTNGNSYFGTGENTIFIVDTITGERRKWQKKDVQDAVRLQDRLSNIDYIMPCGLASDCRPELSPLYHFWIMLKHSNKPIVSSAYSAKGASDILEMAAIAKAGADISSKPFIIHFVSGHAPLIHADVAIENLLTNVRNGIPVIYGSSEVAGSSAPMTLAGTLILNIATGLSALTIAQLERPGAPIIMPGWATNANMRSVSGLFGSPEFSLLICSAVEVFHSLGLPTFGTAGCSDSLVPDAQAAVESCFSCICQALVGANVIHDIGFLESGLSGSLDLLVMSDELLNSVKRFKKGISLDEESLALDIIDRVGPAGSFLTEDHTLKYMKTETWEPHLFTRLSHREWTEAGRKDLAALTKERIARILHQEIESKLDIKQDEELLKIITKRLQEDPIS